MPGLEAAKAYAALIGSICTALLGVFAGDTTVGKVLTVVSVIATVVATYQAPYAVAHPFTSGHKRTTTRHVPKR